MAPHVKTLADLIARARALEPVRVAGVVVGLAAPVVLSSRADPPAARLAALALASLMHHRGAKRAAREAVAPEASLHCAPQPEHACRPMAE